MSVEVYRDGLSLQTDAGSKMRVTKTREGHVVEHFVVGGKPKVFVTLRGTHYCAHGNTVAEAVADALWKDPAKRPSLETLKARIQKAGKNRKITLLEFRTLTGACAEGCRVALARAGLTGEPMTAYDIRDKVSREWGNKLLQVLEWTDKR